MKCESRRILALLLLFVTITGLVVTFGENVLCAGELPGVHDTAKASPGHDREQMHDSDCPGAPSPSHSPNDHFCAGDCGCPCQAPLPSSALTFTYSRSFTYLYHAEPTRHIPEVYLSLFVPPDSATA
jgi:hypothetical protein